eukprot:917547-Rhodomonas_salina.2
MLSTNLNSGTAMLPEGSIRYATYCSKLCYVFTTADPAATDSRDSVSTGRSALGWLYIAVLIGVTRVRSPTYLPPNPSQNLKLNDGIPHPVKSYDA